MTPRRLGVLIANLPAGAATLHAQGGDLSWTQESHLLALMGDLLNISNWQRGGGKGRQPQPFPRPADQAAGAVANEHMRRRADRFLKRHREREEQARG